MCVCNGEFWIYSHAVLKHDILYIYYGMWRWINPRRRAGVPFFTNRYIFIRISCRCLLIQPSLMLIIWLSFPVEYFCLLFFWWSVQITFSWTNIKQQKYQNHAVSFLWNKGVFLHFCFFYFYKIKWKNINFLLLYGNFDDRSHHEVVGTAT